MDDDDKRRDKPQDDRDEPGTDGDNVGAGSPIVIGVLRLARGMTYKTAAAGLDLGRIRASLVERDGVIAQTPALRRRLPEQRDRWRAASAGELSARAAAAAERALACELLAPRPSAHST